MSTTDDRFMAAIRDLDATIGSVEAGTIWRHPLDRLRVLVFRDDAARLQTAFVKGDEGERANLARAAESLAREARQAFTQVIDVVAAPAPAAAPAAPPAASFLPQLVAGGLVAGAVFGGAMIVSAAIRSLQSHEEEPGSRDFVREAFDTMERR